MTTMTTDTPDGERLARLEARVENVERGIQDIRDDIRGLREDNRDLRTEMRELRTEIQVLRSSTDRKFLWVLGTVITMWITSFVLWFTTMLALVNRIGG